MKIKDFGRSIMCAAIAGAFAVGGYAFKHDADDMSKGLQELVASKAPDTTPGYKGMMEAQYLLGITIDRTFEYGCFGGSALAGLIGIVSLPLKRKKLEDNLEE